MFLCPLIFNIWKFIYLFIHIATCDDLGEWGAWASVLLLLFPSNEWHTFASANCDIIFYALFVDYCKVSLVLFECACVYVNLIGFKRNTPQIVLRWMLRNPFIAHISHLSFCLFFSKCEENINKCTCYICVHQLWFVCSQCTH